MPKDEQEKTTQQPQNKPNEQPINSSTESPPSPISGIDITDIPPRGQAKKEETFPTKEEDWTDKIIKK